ncbi:hypothetical protein CV023_11950 [Brevibacterium sp. CCUG 69071]|nr:hypothetical protein [Brevibacterium sp. CCUG 69071]
MAAAARSILASRRVRGATGRGVGALELSVFWRSRPRPLPEAFGRLWEFPAADRPGSEARGV